MPRSGLLAAIAAALGVLALALALPSLLSPQTTTNDPLLRLNPDSIDRIRVRDAASRLSTLRRDIRGVWSLERDDAPPWPLTASQVNGALRLLASLEPTSEAPSSPLADDAPRFEIFAGEPDPKILTIERSSLAGRVRAQIGDERPVFIRADVAEALTDPGPLAWRSVGAIPLNVRDAARVRIETPQGAIALRRVGARWSLEQPAAAPADQDAVARVLDALAALVVDRFLDDSAPPDETTTLIRIEDDIRIPTADGVRVEPIARTLALGAPVGAEGRLVRAFATTHDSPHSLAMIVDAAPLDLLPDDAATLIRASAAGAAPSNVGMIVVQLEDGSSRALRRSVDGWDEVLADGRRIPTDPADADAALALLCVRRPERIAMGDALDAQPLLVVRLFDLADQPLDALRFVRLRDGRAAHDAGGFLRVYPAGALDPLSPAAE